MSSAHAFIRCVMSSTAARSSAFTTKSSTIESLSSVNRFDELRALVTDVQSTFMTTCDTNVNAVPLFGSEFVDRAQLASASVRTTFCARLFYGALL